MESMLSVCSSGLPQGRCVLRGHRLQDEEVAAAVAIVHISPDGTAELEIGAPKTEFSEWTRQDLLFQEEDPPEERWRSIGLLVASLASSASAFRDPDTTTDSEGAREEEHATATGTGSTSEPQEKTADLAGPPPQHADPETADPRQPDPVESDPGTKSETPTKGSGGSAHLQGSFGPQVGLGLAGEGEVPSSYQVGALGRLGLYWESVPVEPDLTVGWSTVPQNERGLSLSWTRVDLSVASRWVWNATDIALKPRLLVLAENVSARAQSASSDDVDRKGRWNVGVGAGAGATYPHTSPWAVTLETVLLRMNGGTGLEVDGERVGTVPATNFRGHLGIVARF